MTVHVLSEQNTILNKFLAQIRDKRIQQDSMRFRRNMERIGEIIVSCPCNTNNPYPFSRYIFIY